MQFPTISVIVPTYKEAQNLPLLVPRIAAALSGRCAGWEVVVVDDNSTDGTPQVLAELQREYPQVRFLIRTHERGLSSAVVAGFGIASGEILVVMDADLSHPPESIPDLLQRLSGDADFVIGSRYIPGGSTQDWSRLRWLNSVGATVMARPLVGKVHDPMAGFFAFRRDLLLTADRLSPLGYKIGLELIVKTRVPAERVAEVPITFHNRKHGQSKLTMREQFRYLEHLSRLYDYRFPKGSPRAKFLIAGAAGGAACAATAVTLGQAGLPSFLSLAAGLLAMIGVTFAFFLRYVRAQRAFVLMQNPMSEFAAISLAEFIVAWFIAVLINQPMLVEIAAAVSMALVTRYTFRKFFLHDIRGIHGEPILTAATPPTPKPAPATPPASTAASA